MFLVLEIDFGIVVLVGGVGYWVGFGWCWFRVVFGGVVWIGWVVWIVVRWCVGCFWLEVFYGGSGFY